MDAMTTENMLVAIRDEAHAASTEALFALDRNTATVIRQRCSRVDQIVRELQDRLGFTDDVLGTS